MTVRQSACWLCLPLCAALLAGCAELARHAETARPTAELTATRLEAISFEQADLVFDLAINNQNPVAINLAGLEYELKIENRAFVSGVTAEGLEIKPVSTSTVQLPLTLKFDDVRQLSGDVPGQDHLDYQLATRFLVDLPVIGRFAIPLSTSGQVPVPKLPAVSIKQVQLKRLDLTTAELVAQVEIENRNAFALDVGALSYQLDVNRQQWGRGKVNKRSSIPGKDTGTVDIPLQLNMLTMGQTTYRVLSKRQPLEYRLTGNIMLDTGIDGFGAYTMPLDMQGKASLR